MSRHVSVSVSMPPELVDAIDEAAEKHNMRASEFIRTCLRRDTDLAIDPEQHDGLHEALQNDPVPEAGSREGIDA